MNDTLQIFFAGDHRRLDELLDRATADPEHFDPEAYGKFRVGLLKHIKMEETIVFPAFQKSNSGDVPALIGRLRLDHGALTALMVPPPSPAILRAIRFILKGHNALEEASEGLYEKCDAMKEGVIEEMKHKLEAIGEVPVVPHRSEPFVLDATRRALLRAGYHYEDFEKNE